MSDSGVCMDGRIIKGIAGFYYVYTEGSGIYECRAKGIFRKQGQKPLVGDRVRIEVLDEKDKEASLTGILPRRNRLFRPTVANVDQAMILTALRDPDPDDVLLDRLLVMMESQDIPVFLCFNKKDLVPEEEAGRWCARYRSCGYDVFAVSAAGGELPQELRERLLGRATVVAGPSGAGKSTITNCMQKGVVMETGGISEKLGRGRHTTRHSQWIPLGEDTWFCDTPGFSALDLPALKKEDLQGCFPEIAPLADRCRFQGCSHLTEPDCAVREALRAGRIGPERYRNYERFYLELKEQEKRRYG